MTSSHHPSPNHLSILLYLLRHVPTPPAGSLFYVPAKFPLQFVTCHIYFPTIIQLHPSPLCQHKKKKKEESAGNFTSHYISWSQILFLSPILHPFLQFIHLSPYIYKFLPTRYSPSHYPGVCILRFYLSLPSIPFLPASSTFTYKYQGKVWQTLTSVRNFNIQRERLS